MRRAAEKLRRWARRMSGEGRPSRRATPLDLFVLRRRRLAGIFGAAHRNASHARHRLHLFGGDHGGAGQGDGADGSGSRAKAFVTEAIRTQSGAGRRLGSAESFRVTKRAPAPGAGRQDGGALWFLNWRVAPGARRLSSLDHAMLWMLVAAGGRDSDQRAGRPGDRCGVGLFLAASG